MSYRIKTVSERTGIPKNTLIAWERRYSIVQPERTASGYRVYSDADIELLHKIKSLVDQGYKISEACALVRKAQQRQGPVSGQVSADGDGLDDLRARLLDRLVEYDRQGADRVVQRLLLVPYETAATRVYFPLLEEVGDRWEKGNLSIAQEHFATSFCRQQLLMMIHAVQTDSPTAPEVVCAAAAGELHELGLLGLALRLSLSGVRVTYLGADVPVSELVKVVKNRKPVGVCVSMVFERTTDSIEAYAETLRELLPKDVHCAIGGRAVSKLDLKPIRGVAFTKGDRLPDWLEKVTIGRVGRM